MNQAKSQRLLGMLGAFICNVLWGLSFIGSKKALQAGIEPFSLVLLRFGVATVLLFAAALVMRADLRVKWKDVPLILATALSGTTVYFFFELNGLKHTSAATASLIVASIPVLTLLLGFLRKKLHPSLLTWLGAAGSLFGVYLVVASDGAPGTVVGALLMMGACVCWILYMELCDHLLKKYSSLTLTCWQSLFSVLTVLPFVFGEATPWTAIPMDAWLWSCLFLGVACSALGYILYNFAIARLAPAQTSIFLNVNPIAAVIGSAFILGEIISGRQIVGGVIILVCLYFVTRAKNEELS